MNFLVFLRNVRMKQAEIARLIVGEIFFATKTEKNPRISFQSWLEFGIVRFRA